MSESILLDEHEGVATITLNRPEKLNAFAGDMRERLAEAIERVAHSHGVRVLVIAGAGRAFCAGGDVRHMADLAARDAGFAEIAPLLEAGAAVVRGLDALPIPTIAKVHGPAAGAGLNLALACDLRIASDDATFGETFVRIGLHPDWGGTFHLPRAVGLAKALELCWTGDVIDAAEALRIGLVERVVPAARLADDVEALAARLAAAPAASVRWIKRSLRAAPGRSLAECLDVEAEAQRACWASADVKEGLAAFVAKRTPRFGSEPVSLEAFPSRAAPRFE